MVALDVPATQFDIVVETAKRYPAAVLVAYDVVQVHLVGIRENLTLNIPVDDPPLLVVQQRDYSCRPLLRLRQYFQSSFYVMGRLDCCYFAVVASCDDGDDVVDVVDCDCCVLDQHL